MKKYVYTFIAGMVTMFCLTVISEIYSCDRLNELDR